MIRTRITRLHLLSDEEGAAIATAEEEGGGGRRRRGRSPSRTEVNNPSIASILFHLPLGSPFSLFLFIYLFPRFHLSGPMESSPSPSQTPEHTHTRAHARTHEGA